MAAVELLLEDDNRFALWASFSGVAGRLASDGDVLIPLPSPFACGPAGSNVRERHKDFTKDQYVDWSMRSLLCINEAHMSHEVCMVKVSCYSTRRSAGRATLTFYCSISTMNAIINSRFCCL